MIVQLTGNDTSDFTILIIINNNYQVTLQFSNKLLLTTLSFSLSISTSTNNSAGIGISADNGYWHVHGSKPLWLLVCQLCFTPFGTSAVSALIKSF